MFASCCRYISNFGLKIENGVTLFSLPSLQMLSDGDYWLEIKAIIGGVLGFWGGVGGLGSLILVIVLSQVREIETRVGIQLCRNCIYDRK